MNNHDEQYIKAQISAYLDGELSQEETHQVEDLILNNKVWQDYYKELQGVSRLLTEHWEDEAVSPDLSSKLKKSLLEHSLKEDRDMKKPSLNKRLAPVLTVAICMIVGLLALQVYTKRGVQGRLTSVTTPYLTQETTQRRVSDANVYFKGQASQVPQTESSGAGPRGYVDLSDSKMISKEERLNKGVQQSNYVPPSGLREQKKTRSAISRPMEEQEAEGVYEPYYLSSNYDVRVDQDRVSKVGHTSQVVAESVAYPQTAPTMAKVARKAFNLPKQDLQAIEMVSPGIAVVDEMGPFGGGENGFAQHYRQNEFNTETYERIYENQFLSVDENPLSTFSIDVDTASYANVRRFLNNNQLPPKDAVRIEEMINYFTYAYPQPRKSDPFSVTLKASTAPWNPNHQLVLVGLQGKTLNAREIPPSNLVFLIDVSGSMNQQNKLPLLKDAFKMMVQQLGPNERVAIVVYAGAAGEVLPSTSGANKHAIMGAIDRLKAGGSTAGGAGIQLAYKIAQQNFIPGGNNRVILATDGDFNIGVSNNADLVRMIEEKRKTGIFFTTLGFGAGNYKDSRMEQLANKGNGNHYYIDTHSEAQKVLVRELGSTLFAIAKDVKLQIEFNPAEVKAYRLIGYENRMLKKEDFNDDTKDAGELGAGHTVTALYELVPAGSLEKFSNVDPLKYQRRRTSSSGDLMTVKLRYKKPDEDKSKLIQECIRMKEIAVQPDADFQFASAVAEFGMLLRDSEFKGNANFNAVLNRARQAQGQDPFGYRAEFIRLVEKARTLMPEHGYIRTKADPYPVEEEHATGGGMFFKGQ